MSDNNENANILNLPKIIKKENFNNKSKASIKKKKPYSKNNIKVKVHGSNNPINRGLSVIDQNNNYIKQSKNNKKEEEKCKESIKENILPSIIPIKENKKNISNKNKEEQEQDIFSKFTKTQMYGLNSSNINLFLNKRESDSLLLKYGEDNYFFNKILEKTIFKIPDTLLQNHKITSNIRTKMVDWMIEVLSVFDCVDETFFLSVNIMDIFYQKTKKVFHNEDVHLIGITSMFISCKFQEIYPISLKNFVTKIGHDMFTQNDIKNMENQILSEIGVEVLVSTSVYDFLKTYFCDFFYNNNSLIKKNCDLKIYNEIKFVAIYLSKLVVHYEYFYIYEDSMKAIGCIVTAIKLVGLYLKDKLSQNERNIYNQWILFLIDQDNFDKQKIESIINKIYLAFNHYQKSKSIAKNLNRFMKLSFLNKIEK